MVIYGVKFYAANAGLRHPLRCIFIHFQPAYQTLVQEFNQRLKVQRIYQGVLCLSESYWASPLHLFPKIDRSWRLCGDYRALSRIADRYPAPYIQDSTSQLAGSKIFPKVDLLRARKGLHHLSVFRLFKS